MASPQKHQVVNLDPFIRNPKLPHPPINISVGNQDTVTWEAGEDFAVINIDKEIDPVLPPNPAKPANPFSRLLPFQARAGADGRFRANSGPAVSGASKQHYKTSFEVLSTGAIIDPDFIVDP